MLTYQQVLYSVLSSFSFNVSMRRAKERVQLSLLSFTAQSLARAISMTRCMYNQGLLTPDAVTLWNTCECDRVDTIAYSSFANNRTPLSSKYTSLSSFVLSTIMTALLIRFSSWVMVGFPFPVFFSVCIVFTSFVYPCLHSRCS